MEEGGGDIYILELTILEYFCYLHLVLMCALLVTAVLKELVSLFCILIREACKTKINNVAIRSGEHNMWSVILYPPSRSVLTYDLLGVNYCMNFSVHAIVKNGYTTHY